LRAEHLKYWPRESVSVDIVANPWCVAFTLLDGFQFKRSRGVVRYVHTVEHCWDLVTAIYTREQQQTQFIDKPSLEESTVDVTSTFQQRTYAEVLPKQLNCFDKINRRSACNNVRDAISRSIVR
jgi:hypothetical protein